MGIDKIIRYLDTGRVKWSAHGLMRMQERGLTISDIKYSIINGEIIEEYQDEPPAKSSVLIYGKCASGKVIHIVVGYDEEQMYFVTAYFPSLDKFESDLKTRRK